MQVFNEVKTIENIDVKYFVEEVFHSQQPVIIKGLAENWKIVQCGKNSNLDLFNYIKSLDNNVPTDVTIGDGHIDGFGYSKDIKGFNFIKQKASISFALDKIISENKKPYPQKIYIESTPTNICLPDFQRQNPCPLLNSNIIPRVWIGGKTKVQAHNDMDHNLAIVAAGTREFLLFPPEQVENLYIGPFHKTPSGPSITLANIDKPDFEKFPRLEAALKTAQLAKLEAGDALFIPQYWWHQVKATAEINMLVNYWWGGVKDKYNNAYNTFLAALLSIKDKSEAEKKYWKAMFDHYIFQINGDPIAHIPPSEQSALGIMSEQERQDFANILKQLMF